MIYRLTVPGTIEDTREVRVLEWHRRVGEPMQPGTLLVELETHKALIEVRAAQPGVLRRVACEEGRWCPTEGLLALLSDDEGEPLPAETDQLAPLLAEFSIG